MPKRKHWSDCVTAAEEARWWDENPDYISEALRSAAKSGKLIRGRRSVTVVDEAPAAIPPQVDVRSIRERVGLSQGAFARRYGFAVRTVQDWEQGRRRPDSSVRAYLLVIDRNPKAVERALQRSA